MADCQTLVDAITELKDVIEAESLLNDEFRDEFVGSFKDNFEKIPKGINKTQSHLAQRLLHRNFLKEKALKDQQLLLQSLASISQQLGLIYVAITGAQPPALTTTVPEPINPDLDIDTAVEEEEEEEEDGGEEDGGEDDGGEDGGDDGGDFN